MVKLSRPSPATKPHLTIIVNDTTPWSPKDYDAGLMNGSEEMVVLFAREMAKNEYTVTVYCSLKEGRLTDVVFKDDIAIHYYDLSYVPSRTHRDVLIAFKSPEALSVEGFDRKFLWTADRTSLTANQRRACNGLFAISKWHESELKSVNVGYKYVSFIEPGVSRPNYRPIVRRNKQCLYASSPDRGLDFLEEIWPQIQLAHPDARLVVTYKNGNRRSNEDMDDLYLQSDILAYPCMGQERYCLSAIKAQINGCIPCVIPHMALKDTVQFGVKCLKDDYAESIIRLMNDEDRHILREDMIKNVKYSNWNDVVEKWEAVIG